MRDYIARPAFRRLADGRIKPIAPEVVVFEITREDGSTERLPYMPDAGTHGMTFAEIWRHGQRIGKMVRPDLISSWPYRCIVADAREFERLLARGYFSQPGATVISKGLPSGP